MRAVWINPVSTGSTSLDPNVNPHDLDTLAITRLLEKEGFEVWVQEAYVKPCYHSTWPNRVFSKDLKDFKADVAILNCNPFLIDYMSFRYWGEITTSTSRARQLKQVTEWLDNFDGPVYIPINDPRPRFQDLWKPRTKQRIIDKGRKLHPMFHHLDKAKFLVADTNFLLPELRHRGVECDYWKVVDLGDPFPFNEKNDYFCVYPGVKLQKGVRKKLVTDWLDVPECYTVGDVDLPNIPSLSDYNKVPLKTVLDLTRRSTTALVCGEPAHTWITPRVIQSMMCGTICSIHPNYAGSHHFPAEILRRHAASAASEFNVELSKKVYDQQVEFIMSLSDGPVKSGVM